MNEIVNKFLLAGDKLMLETHLRHHGFSYNACTPTVKSKKKTVKKHEIHDIFIKRN